MASAIDPTKPRDGVPPLKADLRANLHAAKEEIEALQSGKAPLESPSFVGTVTLPQVDGQKSKQTTASGSLAGSASGRTHFIIGNVVDVPTIEGWHGTFRNKSGSSVTISPATGICRKTIDGATAASVTLENGKACFAEGDGNDLWVDGDVT